MNRFTTVLLIFVFLVSLTAIASAQREVVIEPTAFGILNDTIDGDTTETGERVDENTVYVLKREYLGNPAYYVLSRSIENRFPLTIVAEDGAGEKPKIVPGVVEGGSSRAFRPRDNITIKGCYVTNRDQEGGINKNMFRVSADDAILVFDDCHLDYDTQSAFRLDDDGISVYMTNTIVSNIGETISMDNGRVFDTRGNAINTIIARNNTFYNITSRVLRDGGGTIMHAEFDNNTFNNVGQFALSFGETVTGYFTNNMLVNCQYLGNSKNDETPRAWVNADSLADSALAANYDQVFVLSHNNYFLNVDLVSAYPDSVNSGPFLNVYAQKLVDEAGTGNTILTEDIKFTKAPAVPTDVVTAIWAGSTEPPAMDDGDVPEFGNPGYGVMPFDYSYPTGTSSYVGGMDGRALGSLAWFGITDVEPEPGFDAIPGSFALHGNYPNPFNPTTNIRFDLDKAADVQITVYNNLGQVVMVTDPQKMNPGMGQSITIDAVNLASGLYLYKVTANTGSLIESGIGRMLLVK